MEKPQYDGFEEQQPTKFCWFFFHEWSNWYERFIMSGYHKTRHWEERHCFKCNKKQTRSCV